MPQHRCPPAQFRPWFRWLVPAVVLLISSCGTPPMPPPEPPRPFGAAKVTPSSEPVILPKPDQVPHLTFQGVNQHVRPTPLWVAQTSPAHRPYGDPLISPDGRWLVLATETSILVFDLQERKVVAQRICPGRIVRLFVDRTGQCLIGLFNSSERPHATLKEGHSTLGFWTLPTLEFTSRPLLPDYIPATTAALTHAQDRMLAMGIDRSIAVFDVATGQQQLRFDRHQGAEFGPHVTHKLGGIGLTHDDQIVTSYTGGPHPNGRLRRWRLADGQEIPTGPEGYDYDRNGGYLMTYTADDRHVLTGGSNWGLTLNKAENGHGVYSYPESGYRDYDSRNPNVAINRRGAGRFGVINVATGQLLFKATHEAEPPQQYPELHWSILSPDGRTIYTGANYGYIFAWDFAAAAGLPPDELLSGHSWTSLIAINGTRAQTLEDSPGPRSFDRVIEWDLDKRTFLSSAPSEAFSRKEYLDAGSNTTRWQWGSFILKGNICTIVGRKGEARAYEPMSGRTLFHLGAPGAVPTPNQPLIVFEGSLALSASPDGTVLAVGSRSGNPLTLWHPEGGRFLGSLDGHTAGVTSVQYSPDGQRLITGDNRGKTLIRLTKPKPAPEKTPEPDSSGMITVPLSLQSGVQPRDWKPPVVPYTPPPPEWVTLPAAESAGFVAHISTNHDGTLVAVAHATGGPYSHGANGAVTVWQETPECEWRQLFSCKLPRAPLRIALSPDSRLLAVSQLNFMGKSNGSGESYGEVFILDARTGELRSVLDWVDARDLAFLNDHQLATVGNGMQIWNLP